MTPPPPRRWHADEEGAVVLWLLGVSVMILMLGGLSIDLWHVFGERRVLVGAADAAAYAGASGLDEATYRATGTVRLSPARAEELARRAVARQPDTAALTRAEVAATAEAVTVTLHGRVDVMLLRLLAPGTGSLDVTVTATAEPRLGG